MTRFPVTVSLLASLVVASARSESFGEKFPSKDLNMIRGGPDPGEPLFLTPYIEKGDISTGQKLSLVQDLPGTTLKSHAGFLTVDKKYNSNMFFWFFPAQTAASTAPFILWLQGGPGSHALFGLFNENGPFTIDANLELKPKPVTWNKKYSMLYIDNPEGTGFSFTDSDDGYSTNETQMAENLYCALTQFFTLFPDFAPNDFYVAGESYAGKYIPAIGYKIMQEGNASVVNLRGIVIGEGLVDPESMLPAYSDFLFNIGLLDENQRDDMANQSKQAVDYIKEKQYLKAREVWSKMLGFYQNASGLHDNYNYMRAKIPVDFLYYADFVQFPQVRKAIHVGNLTLHSADKVAHHLANDMMQSVKPWLQALMNKYKVLLYSGQLDVVVALPLTEAMLQTMDWDHAAEYKAASRSVWKLKPTDDDVAGYVRNVDKFYQVEVRAGGHILPYDQPERAFDMIDRFILEKPFA